MSVREWEREGPRAWATAWELLGVHNESDEDDPDDE